VDVSEKTQNLKQKAWAPASHLLLFMTKGKPMIKIANGISISKTAARALMKDLSPTYFQILRKLEQAKKMKGARKVVKTTKTSKPSLFEDLRKQRLMPHQLIGVKGVQ
jgi:hypothetical protein